VHFVIYEAIKARLIAARVGLKESDDNSKSSKDFLEFMMAGAVSKTVASCIAYPHGNLLCSKPFRLDSRENFEPIPLSGSWLTTPHTLKIWSRKI